MGSLSSLFQHAIKSLGLVERRGVYILEQWQHRLRWQSGVADDAAYRADSGNIHATRRCHYFHAGKNIQFRRWSRRRAQERTSRLGLKQIHKFFRRYLSLAQDGSKRAPVNLAVIWHHRLSEWVITPHNDVTAMLAPNHKTLLLKGADQVIT